jgi:polyisoprenoid-binding protein YceI
MKMAKTNTLSLLAALGFVFGAISGAGVAAPAQAEERTYSIVPSQSALTILVGKAGALSGLGHEHLIAAKAFTGRAVLPMNEVSRASFVIELDAASLSVRDKGISDKDRTQIQSAMQTKVIETARFPKISFRSASLTNLQASTNGYTLTITGDLSLHGLVKRIAVPVVLSITPEQLRATGEVVIKQTDFGIKPYSAAAGTVKVMDVLQIKFEIVARPAETGKK